MIELFDPGPGEPAGGGRSLDVAPMSPMGATGWTAAATFAFAWLLSILMALRPAAEDDVITKFGCQLATYLAALFAILRLYAPDASIRAFLGLRRTHLGFFPVAVALGAAITVPANWLYEVIEARYPEPELEERLLDMFKGASTPMLVAIGVFFVALGPALEEVFFRGGLFQPLRQRLGPAAVIALTAVLFAVAHIAWQRFASIAIVGACLCLVRWASGSLFPSMCLHAAFNALPFYGLLVASRGEPEPEQPVSLALGLGGTAASVVLVALVVVLARTDGARRARGEEGAA
jgi:membrane protease YdiL (CAAX protease family)